MSNDYIELHAPVNIAGQLFNRTNESTPLFNMLGAPVTTQSREFIVGAQYTNEAAADDNAVSEVASRTAPDAVQIQPTQVTNLTQINHYAVDATYRGLSNSDELTGLNLADQSGNVPNQLDFAIANKVRKMRNDMEKTIFNGVYNKATDKTEIDETRGFRAAITTNVVAAGGIEWDVDVLGDLAEKVATGSPEQSLEGMVLVVGAKGKRQITNNVVLAYGQTTPASRTVGGANVTEILTDFGTIYVMFHRFATASEGLLLRPSIARVVGQPVPGKGNYFYEALAKDGAAERGQIYAQWGLDHGLEWFHGKVTGLATTLASAAS